MLWWFPTPLFIGAHDLEVFASDVDFFLDHLPSLYPDCHGLLQCGFGVLTGTSLHPGEVDAVATGSHVVLSLVLRRQPHV